MGICNPHARIYAKAFAIMGDVTRLTPQLCCIIARDLRRFSYTGFLPLGLFPAYFDANYWMIAHASARARKNRLLIQNGSTGFPFFRLFRAFKALSQGTPRFPSRVSEISTKRIVKR